MKGRKGPNSSIPTSMKTGISIFTIRVSFVDIDERQVGIGGTSKARTDDIDIVDTRHADIQRIGIPSIFVKEKHKVAVLISVRPEIDHRYDNVSDVLKRTSFFKVVSGKHAETSSGDGGRG